MGPAHIITLLVCLTPLVQSLGGAGEDAYVTPVPVAPTAGDAPTPVGAPTSAAVSSAPVPGEEGYVTPVPPANPVAPGDDVFVAPNTLQPTQRPTTPPTRPPTLPVDPDMFAVTFEEYEEGASCGSEQFKRGTCYKDSEGNHYRYGCKSDDGLKIYTDSCGKDSCAPANCQNNWKWLSEEANMCLVDEANIFKFTCHAPGATQGVESVEEPDVVEPVVEPESCGSLGWPVGQGSDKVCAYSAVLNGRCSGETDLFTARRACARAGARLCSADELAADETKGSGCKFDCARVWSSTKCTTTDGGVGFTSAAGAKKCEPQVPSRCEDPAAQTAVIRCCADVGEGEEAVVEGPQDYPPGFTKAVSSDYSGADGECGTTPPLRQYSCWNNPLDGSSQRFACRPGSNMVWAQSCGSSSDCSKCAGEWFTQDESVNTCYASDNLLYSYSCL